MQALRRLSQGSKSSIDQDSERLPISAEDAKTEKAINGLIKKSASSNKIFPQKPVAPPSEPPATLPLSDTIRRNSVPGTSSNAAKARSLRGTNELKKYQAKMKNALFNSLETDHFVKLTEEMLRKMSLDDREHLSESLTKWKGPIATLTPDLQEEVRARVSKGLSILNQMKEESQSVREKALVECIAENRPADSTSTQDVLLLSAQSIISIDALFKLLLTEIKKRADKESPRGITVMLLLFCQKWIHHNRGTTLIALATPRLNEIIAETQCGSHSKVKEQSDRVLATLQEAGRYSPDLLKYPKLKDKYTEFNLSTLDKIAEVVAHDLLCFQAQLFCQIQRDHLITKKWAKKPRVLEEIDSLQNSIPDFIVSLLLNEKILENRISIVRFFLKVENLALKNNDLATAFAISSVWARGPLARLKSTFVKFTNEIKDQEWVSSSNGHFSGIKERYKKVYAKFRENGTREYAYIPLLNLVSGDLERIESAEPTHIESPKDGPRYNLSKLVHILDFVEGILKPQTALSKKDGEFVFQTDFVMKCIAHKPLPDIELYKLAELLASPTSSPRE